MKMNLKEWTDNITTLDLRLTLALFHPNLGKLCQQKDNTKNKNFHANCCNEFFNILDP